MEQCPGSGRSGRAAGRGLGLLPVLLRSRLAARAVSEEQATGPKGPGHHGAHLESLFKYFYRPLFFQGKERKGGMSSCGP